MTARTAALALAKASKDPDPEPQPNRAKKQKAPAEPTGKRISMVDSDLSSVSDEEQAPRKPKQVKSGGPRKRRPVADSDDSNSESESDDEDSDDEPAEGGADSSGQPRAYESDDEDDDDFDSDDEEEDEKPNVWKVGKGKTRRPTSEPDMDEDDYEFKPWRKGPPPKKKKKKVTKWRNPAKVEEKPEKGELEAFKALPAELLGEVFSHLKPLDVLMLARTSKHWRNLLLSKNSVWIWNRVLTAMPCDFPACPSDLAHPEYVSLVWDDGCQLCGYTWAPKECYELHIRLCKRCARLNIVDKTRCAPLLGEVDPRVVTLIPCWTHAVGRRRTTNCKRYYLPDIRWVEGRLQDLEADISNGKKGAKKALQKFIAEREAAVKEVSENAKAIEEWKSRHSVWRKEEDKRARTRRKDAIINRFVALGYDKTAFAEKSWFKDNFRVDSVTRVNDEEWTKIRDPLQKHLDERIADDHATRLETLRTPRRLSLFALYRRGGVPEGWPKTLIDFGGLESVKEIVNSDVDIDDALYAARRPEIELEIDNIRHLGLATLLVKVGIANGESTTLDDFAADNTTALGKVLEGIDGGFRYIAETGSRFVSPQHALELIAKPPAPRSRDPSHYDNYNGSLVDRTKQHCASAFKYLAGDANFVKALVQANGAEAVWRAIKDSSRNLESGNFACPGCPDRPKRSLANLLGHISCVHGDQDILSATDPNSLASLMVSAAAQRFENVQVSLRGSPAYSRSVRCYVCAHPAQYWYTGDVESHIRQSHGFEPVDEDLVW